MITELDAAPGSTQPPPEQYKAPTRCFFCEQIPKTMRRVFRIQCDGLLILMAHRRCARKFVDHAERGSKA